VQWSWESSCIRIACIFPWQSFKAEICLACSTALLMPDGTVFSGGGGLCGLDCKYNHFDGQVGPAGSTTRPAALPYIWQDALRHRSGIMQA
jgi:hypothetical protein